MQTLHVHVGLCFPFPLGGWMHTMHEHPGRCLGCLVVVATDAPPGSLALSPRTAVLGRASRVAESCSCTILWLINILCFLNSVRSKSEKKHHKYFKKRSYVTKNQVSVCSFNAQPLTWTLIMCKHINIDIRLFHKSIHAQTRTLTSHFAFTPKPRFQKVLLINLIQ